MNLWRRLKNLWVLSGLEDLRYVRDDIAARASRKQPATIIDTQEPLDKIQL